ncbi:C40 family peptidase [Calidifontibacter terrae]
MSFFASRGRHTSPTKFTTSVRATALMAAAGGIAATAAASSNTAVAATGNVSMTAAPAQVAPAAAAVVQARPASLQQTAAAAPQLNLVYAKRLVAQQHAKTTPAAATTQVSRSSQRPTQSATRPAQAQSTTRHSATTARATATTTRTKVATTTRAKVAAPKTTSTVDNTPATGGIVSIASRYIGVPYVFGGSSPSGFDCSGLTQYVFAQAGISIPRTASAQVAAMRHVSNPQPGDLVYFGSPAHHIGIYVGGGKMIAAPYPGQSVRLQPIWDTPTGYLRA